MTTCKHEEPYHNPDYEGDGGHEHDHAVPPDNPRYPDSRIYGQYASKEPPRYVPHPYDHICFKPRKEDYKPPMPFDGGGDNGDGLCSRRNQRSLTVDPFHEPFRRDTGEGNTSNI